MTEKVGLKGRLARMFLNFLDEHGDYRTQLEEAAARAAAASASSLLAKDREGRKKKRRRGRFGIGADDDDDDDDDEELEELESQQQQFEQFQQQQQQQAKNQLPEDPYDQVQFYIRTFRQRTAEQFLERLQDTQAQVQNWMHEELHHPLHVPALSSSILVLCGLTLAWRRRRAESRRISRIHGIMGKKYVASAYLHPNFLRGKVLGEYTSEGIKELEKLKEKAIKAEEAALASMRPYQRRKYERLQKMELVGEWVVTVWLWIGMVASACCAVISLGTVYGYFSEYGVDFGGANETEQLDGYIYSLDGPVDDDGYPLSIKNEAEENYALCLSEAEARGVEDPTTECDVHSFFEAAAAAANKQLQQQDPPLSSMRNKILELLNRTRLPPTFNTYIVTLPTQTIAYLSSLFSFFLFLLSHYISHKIHVATLSNDPMKHFVATANDSTIKADGTVTAKKGETEAQRKRRERMLQQEKMKAQMAQLAMEAKQKVEARRRRLEGEEAVKKEEEEKEVKKKEERDETVKMYSRQFMMLKAGVPERAILNSFLAEGIEDEEGKEIIEKLKEIKEKRAEEARKEEEKEEERRKKEAEEEKEKDRIAAERLRLMKQGSIGSSSSAKKPPQSLPGPTSFVRGKSVGSAASSAKTDSVSFTKVNLRKSLPANSTSAKSNDGASSPATSSIATASTTRTTSSSKKEDPSVAKGKMLGDISKVSLGSLRKTKTPARVGVKVIDGSAAEGAKSDDSSPLGTEKVWDKDSKSWVSTTPLKSNVTPGAKKNFIQFKEEEEKKENESSQVAIKQISELTSSGIDLDESPTPPLMTLASSPSTDFVSIDTTDPIDSFDTPSGWGRRLTAADIQAQIEAVEAEDDGEEESIEHEPQDLNLGPNSFYSPAFDQAIRNSNASWDRRPSSRDIMARIKEAEELEAKHAEIEDDLKRAEMIRSRSANRLGRDGLPMIGENQYVEPTSSVEVRRKARAGDDDSEVSELSMTTYEDNPLEARGRSIPNALFLRQDSGNAKVPFSPALTSSPSPGFLNSKGYMNEKAQEAIRMAEKGELNLPPLPAIQDESSSTIKSDTMSGKDSRAESREETEEERTRRERAEKRAKKMEEMAAKRNKGEDDGTSVSGLSKLRRRRKKKIQDEANITADVKDTEKEVTPVVVMEETEEEKQRRLRAEKRAKKMEEMAAKRNTGKDDDTAVSGISKHHRMRRKKSALAANAEDKAKVDYCSNIFSRVLNAEQAQWQRSIYSHVLNAEQTRETNVTLKRSIEEMDEQARRIRENQKNLEARAKKRAAKADRFHKLRQEGASNDDDSSVVSSKSRMRRRRARKSTSKPMDAPIEVEETIVDEKISLITSPKIGESLEQDDGASLWGQEIFMHVISADQAKWKKSVFNHVLDANSKRTKRLEVEALVEDQRALAEARLEKDKMNELRAKKMEKIQSSRRTLGEENISPETNSVASVGGSSMKKMRDRRRKAALAKKAAQS